MAMVLVKAAKLYAIKNFKAEGKAHNKIQLTIYAQSLCALMFCVYIYVYIRHVWKRKYTHTYAHLGDCFVINKRN